MSVNWHYLQRFSITKIYRQTVAHRCNAGSNDTICWRWRVIILSNDLTHCRTAFFINWFAKTEWNPSVSSVPSGRVTDILSPDIELCGIWQINFTAFRLKRFQEIRDTRTGADSGQRPSRTIARLDSLPLSYAVVDEFRIVKLAMIVVFVAKILRQQLQVERLPAKPVRRHWTVE